MKKFWKYFIIILLLLLGLCCIGVLYLFFVPGSSLFNITYISLDKTFSSQVYDVNESSFSTIKINSRGYDVALVPVSNSSTVSVQVFANSFGFVLNQNKSVNISSSVEDATLTFTIAEPFGFALKNQSRVSVFVPQDFSFNYNLSNESAYTYVSSKNDLVLNVNSLNYTTKSGDFSLSNCKINNNLYLDLGSASFKLEKDVTLAVDGETSQPTNDVYLKMGSGSFNAGDYNFNNVVVESNKNGSVILNNCAQLTSENAEAGGRVKIKNLNRINFVGADTNVNINELAGGTITLTRSGNINIEHATNDVTLSSKSGNIVVNKADHSVIANNEDGNITINNSYSAVQARTVYGNIDVTFAEDAQSYLESGAQTYRARNLIASTTNGKITASGVHHIVLDIENRGNGRAEIYMDNVYGEDNHIYGYNGSVSVKVKELPKEEAPNGHAHYWLKTKSNSKDVSVNVHTNPNYGGYGDDGYNYDFVNSRREDFPHTYNNIIEITTNNGSLHVFD